MAYTIGLSQVELHRQAVTHAYKYSRQAPYTGLV